MDLCGHNHGKHTFMKTWCSSHLPLAAGRVKDAILSYNKALSLEPMSPVAAPNKLMAMNCQCSCPCFSYVYHEFASLLACRSTLPIITPCGGRSAPSPDLAEYSVQAIYEEHRVWGKEAVRSVKQHSWYLSTFFSFSPFLMDVCALWVLLFTLSPLGM